MSFALRVAGGFLALLVAAAGGLAVYVSTRDLDAYGDRVARGFEQATGRGLTIGGGLRLARSWPPTVVAEDVAVANAAWGAEPRMATARRVEASVALLPLLSGELRVRRVVVVAPDLLLETDGQGQANWTLGHGASSGVPAPGLELPELAGLVLQVEDGRLEFRHGRTGRVEVVEQVALSARADSLDAALDLTARGVWAGREVNVQASVGELRALLGGARVSLDARVSAGGTAVTMSGDLGRPPGAGARTAIAEPSAPSLALAVSLDAPSAESLAALVGRSLPPLAPVSLRGTVKRVAGRYSVSGLDARAGDSDLSGDLEVDLSGERVEVVADLRARRLVLDDFLGSGGAPRSGGRSSEPGRVFSRDPLPLQPLRAADVRVRVAADVVEARGHRFAEATLEAELRSARLRATPAGQYAGGRVWGEVTVDASAAAPGLGLALHGRDVALAEAVNAWMQRPFATGGPTDIDLDVGGSGDSIAALMASLSGSVRVVVGGARFDNRVLRDAGGATLLDLIDAVDPLARKRDAGVLECAVVRFDVDGGVARSDRGIALETDRIVLAASGTVDLATEEIDVGIRPRPRDGVNIGAGQVARLVRVRGRLAAPEPGVDPGGVAMAGATVGAAVATGGLSLLVQGLLAAVGFDSPPCAVAAGEGQRTSATRSSPRAADRPAAPSAGEKALRGALDGIGGALKGLFGR